MNNKVYILSTGRSGTTFLSNYLKQNFPNFIIEHQKIWSRILNILGNLPIWNNDNAIYLFKIFTFLKKTTIPENTLDPLLSISLCNFINANILKDVKIIHLVRDPRDFVSSFMNWKAESISKRILHYLIPFWQPYLNDLNISFFRWLFMSKFEKYCWVWYYKNLKFMQLDKKSNYLLIKMEDITKATNNNIELSKLLNFLELKKQKNEKEVIINEKVNKSTSTNFPKYQNWKDNHKNKLNNICGILMNQLGYQLIE